MVNQFFFPKNTVDNLSEKDLHRQLDYREAIYALARTTYSSLYVINYATQAFEYVSENPLFLCGHTAQEVQDMGYAFYYKYVTKEDLDLLTQINKIGFDFFDTIPISERRLYTISYDFHLQSDVKKKILVNQKLTPMFLTDSGKIWKALCTVSLSTQRNSGNIQISKKGYNQIFKYDLEKNRWNTVEVIKLTEREKEVLQFSIRGFTINEIAQEIFVSPETIKFHRRKLFDKMGVTNMSEAIFYAANNKLL
ncbi:LuxR family transcriptional regulator [Sphingobacterium sp. ML3W]|uniref:response regulator transcription factor n=1 Tax=Sphingobacterium sp. ML3W TaxID=1538644 RepID=UPI0004F7BCB9|nr:helix-turn-helix transcriptional regulator [Sphingobacterium sp. ML3W]AIM39240.1 LuxR family transcriptional regulator [Sphingobacterium sp. ML3W]